MSANNEKENRLTLDLLGAIEQKDDVSQRHLAQHMGVALGMANSYLKRCVKKGWIKVTTAPANRYMYYLTPKGFAEKARITGEFLSTSLALVKQSGEAYTQFFSECAKNDKQKIVFVGLSDLTEIAYLRAIKSQLDVVGIFAPRIEVEGQPVTETPESWFDIPVSQELPEEWQNAILVFTTLENAYLTAELIKSNYSHCELFVPEFLSLSQAVQQEQHSDFDSAANQ